MVENETGYKIVDITAAGVLNNNNSQVYAIKNPLSFVYNQNEPWDWYTNTGNHNDALWNGDLSTKSNYDPCPKEWRIPTDASKTFGDFSNTTFLYYIHGSQTSSGNYNVTNGRQYNQISWFPASGGRRSNSGGLAAVGSRGYCWSASQNDTFTKYLYFDMSGVGPGNSGRALGFPVRCVQE